MKRGGFLGRLWRNERGNVLIITAAALPLTIGSAAMTTDMIQWVVWKRELQRQADSGALAGAFSLTQSKTVSSTVTADLTKNADTTLTVTSTIENAPTAGSYAGNTKAVRVLLSTSRKLPFSSLFLTTAPTIKAEATAAIIASGNYCVVALEKTASVGISIGGNATVNMGCGMIANSTGTNTIDAVNAYGSAAVTASPIAAVGDLTPDSHFASGTTFLPYSPPQADPFAALPNPVLPADCPVNTMNDITNLTVQPSETLDIYPGCYTSGVTLKGTVTMHPGVYYIDGSSFQVNSSAVITGTGVTIILTSSSAATSGSSVASIDINGGATLNLSAPTSGTYAGVLIYQDRRANDSGTEKINGNATTFLQGAVYMPSRQVQFTGTAGMTTNCLQLVARRVVFSGNAAINNSCPSGSGAGSFAGTRVRLVA